MKKRQLNSKQKFNIVLESFKENDVAKVARRYNINATLLSKWRAQFIEIGQEIFTNNSDKEKKELIKKVTRLEQLIGKKEVEISLLQNFLDEYQSPKSK